MNMKIVGHGHIFYVNMKIVGHGRMQLRWSFEIRAMLNCDAADGGAWGVTLCILRAYVSRQGSRTIHVKRPEDTPHRWLDHL
jgi:hypothetical protein